LSQPASFSENGSSLLCRSGVANCGSIVPAFRYFLIVLRDIPVRRAISRRGNFSRNAMRRMMFKSPMCITPMSPVAYRAGGRVTWVNSQWKLCSYPDHTSVEINSYEVDGPDFTGPVIGKITDDWAAPHLTDCPVIGIWEADGQSWQTIADY
jgi:hypothetical protein